MDPTTCSAAAAPSVLSSSCTSTAAAAVTAAGAGAGAAATTTAVAVTATAASLVHVTAAAAVPVPMTDVRTSEHMSMLHSLSSDLQVHASSLSHSLADSQSLSSMQTSVTGDLSCCCCLRSLLSLLLSFCCCCAIFFTLNRGCIVTRCHCDIPALLVYMHAHQNMLFTTERERETRSFSLDPPLLALPCLSCRCNRDTYLLLFSSLLFFLLSSCHIRCSSRDVRASGIAAPYAYTRAS